MNTLTDQYHGYQIHNLKPLSFTSADGKQELISEHAFVISDDSWIEDHFQIVRTLHYEDKSLSTTIIVVDIPFQMHLKVELGNQANW